MKQKSLKTNAILNGIRQACSIVFPLITFPYISRVLGSEGYGKYSFSQSITSYFILFAALGINTYAIREGAKIRDDKDRINIFCSQVYSINVVSGLVSLILLGMLIIGNARVREYAPYILIESTAIVMAVIGVNWVNSIYEDFLYLTLRYIVVQILALMAMFIFVRKPSDIIPYCIISVLATNGGNLINLFYVRRYVKIRFTFNTDLKKHLKPLLILFLNAVAITIYVNSDITMLGFFSDDSVVGIYSFASKIYNILKQLINALVVVSLPRIAYIIKNHSSNYELFINKIFSALSICMWPIVVGMLLLSNDMIMIAGGSQYINGASSLRILSIAMIFAIYASLFTNCVLIVYRQEDKCLRATLVSAIVNIGLNFVLIPRIGMFGAAITTAIAEVLNCLIQVKYSKLYYDWKKLDFIGNYSCLVGAVIVGLIIIICKNNILNIFVRLGVSVAVSSVVYPGILLALKNQYAIEALESIQRKLNRHKV